MEQMEQQQIQHNETTENAILPPSPPEPRWDPEKAAKRKVRVLKVPHGEDPMEEKTIFEFGGFVYICYAVKTRGRYMIRCLGLADVERLSEKEKVPFESGKLLDNAKYGLDEDDRATLLRETTKNLKLPDEIVPTKELGADAMGDAINDAIDKDIMGLVVKEAIEDETVQKVIKEVAGDGQSRGPDETPNS